MALPNQHPIVIDSATYAEVLVEDSQLENAYAPICTRSCPITRCEPVLVHTFVRIFDKPEIDSICKKLSKAYVGHKSKIFWTVENATAFSILALGAMTAHEGTSLPKPKRCGRESCCCRGKNNSSIPGMTYYASAAVLATTFQTGNTASHARLMILLALYQGQCGRLQEAWVWLSFACRILYNVIKSRDTMEAQNAKPEGELSMELIWCMFWICIELEGQIMQSVPHLEHTCLYPWRQRALLLQALVFDMSVVLHEHTTKLHSIVSEDLSFSASYRALLRWRKSLPGYLVWLDRDLPSVDMRIARFRATYYQKLFRIIQPYTKAILQHLQSFTNLSSSSQQSELVRRVESMYNFVVVFDRVDERADSQYEPTTITTTRRPIVISPASVLHAQAEAILSLVTIVTSGFWQEDIFSILVSCKNVLALVSRAIRIF